MKDHKEKSGGLTAFLDYAKLPGLKRRATCDVVPVLDECGHNLNCVNCGTPLAGPYCSHCGQKDEDLKRPMWSFFSEIGDYMLSFDSRFMRTLIHLLFSPGLLTRAYLDGKRARFMPPIRMYLIATLTFFLSVTVLDVAIMSFSLAPNEEGSVTSTVSSGQGLALKMFEPFSNLPVESGVPHQTFETLKTREGVPDVAVRLLNGLETVADDPHRMNDLLNKWIPRAMIILLPLFALLLKLFYWGKGQYLLNHLVFSLHYHTYIFLVTTFFMFAQYALGGTVSAALFVGALPLYLLVAMKVISKQGWLKTIMKFAFILPIYWLVFASTLIGVIVMGLAEI